LVLASTLLLWAARVALLLSFRDDRELLLLAEAAGALLVAVSVLCKRDVRRLLGFPTLWCRAGFSA
jgi:hypothetical protein